MFITVVKLIIFSLPDNHRASLQAVGFQSNLVHFLRKKGILQTPEKSKEELPQEILHLSRGKYISLTFKTYHFPALAYRVIDLLLSVKRVCCCFPQGNVHLIHRVRVIRLPFRRGIWGLLTLVVIIKKWLVSQGEGIFPDVQDMSSSGCGRRFADYFVVSGLDLVTGLEADQLSGL